MPIVRNDPHRKNFTAIPNESIRDERLSLSAKGLHHLLLSYPANWQVNVKHLSGICKEGRDKIYKLLKELEHHGYIVRSQERINGKFNQTIFTVYSLPLTENPDTAKPDTAKPDTENPDAYKRTNKQTTEFKKELLEEGEQKKSDTSKADFDDLADARINHSSLVSKENNPEQTKLPSENLPEVTTKNKQYRQGSTVPPQSVKNTSLQSKRVRSRKEQVKSLIGDRTEDTKGFLKWRGEQLVATDFYKNTNVTEDVVLHFYAKKLRGFSDEEKAEALQEVTEAIEVDLQRWPGRNQQKVKSQKEALFDEIAALHEKDPVAAMELGHHHHVWNAFYWERLRNA